MRCSAWSHRATALATMAALLIMAGACAATPPASSPGSSTATTASSPQPPTATATPAPDLAAPGTRLQGLSWQGTQRTYVVHAPPDYRRSERLPLVLVLHYLGGSGEKMRRMTRFDAKADQERFLVVYVDGVSAAFNALACCGDRDDVGYVKAIIDHMGRFWGVDLDRVYATGISNGADMAFRLAIELEDTFAAIAPISGGFIGPRAESDPGFKPGSPVSVISIIGKLDRGFARFDRGLANWRQRLGCAEQKAGPPTAGVAMTTARCQDGSDVVLYTVDVMGHAWPGGVESETMGDEDAAVSATDLMWSFFAAHTRRP